MSLLFLNWDLRTLRGERWVVSLDAVCRALETGVAARPIWSAAPLASLPSVNDPLATTRLCHVLADAL